MEEMQAEKDKIEAEKAENAKMLEELKALKAQLESKGAVAQPAASEAKAEEPSDAE